MLIILGSSISITPVSLYFPLFNFKQKGFFYLRRLHFDIVQEFIVKEGDRIELMAMLGVFGAVVSAIQMYSWPFCACVTLQNANFISTSPFSFIRKSNQNTISIAILFNNV